MEADDLFLECWPDSCAQKRPEQQGFILNLSRPSWCGNFCSGAGIYNIVATLLRNQQKCHFFDMWPL